MTRSLAACEGVLLLMDAAQGIQAQTIANYHLAKEAGLAVIPVVTKMDLPNGSEVLHRSCCSLKPRASENSGSSNDNGR